LDIIEQIILSSDSENSQKIECKRHSSKYIPHDLLAYFSKQNNKIIMELLLSNFIQISSEKKQIDSKF